MVSLPRDISAGAAARRALLADLLVGIAIALLAFQVAAGIGVVGFLALLIVLVLVPWIAIETAIRMTSRNRKVRRARSPKHSSGSSARP